MGKSIVLPFLNKFLVGFMLVCLLASFGGEQVVAQPASSASGGPADPHIFLPLVTRSCSAPPSFVSQCVDCPKYYYDMTPGSLRLDANDHPHIAYGGDHLYHAWNDGATWHYEIVDDAPGVGIYASLAIDSTGKPAIAYYDRYNEDLKFARWNGSSWTISVIDSAQFSGFGTLVLFDASNVPQVAYIGMDSIGNYLVKFTRWNGSSWAAYPAVDTKTDRYFSLALDKFGQPHLSYFGDNGLMYASWTGSAWERQTVVADSSVGAYNSLAFDSQGNPHISYYDFFNVAYASRAGSSTWTTETIAPRDMSEYSPTTLTLDSSDNPIVAVPSGYVYYKKNSTWHVTWWVGQYASLALDKAGKPHISSLEGNQHQLAYARLTDWGGPSTSETWEWAYLDTKAIVVGMGVQMAVDASGNPHLAYLDNTQHRLQYATQTYGCWQIQTVNPIGTSSPADSIGIALDPAGQPHISYVDVYNKKIVYASRSGSSWNLENVADDSPGYQGTFERYLSLAISSDGTPFISFYDGGSLSLKMAKKVANAWQVELVDGTGSSYVGIYNSIAVDSLGHPHISYLSYPNKLWYAHWTGSSWAKVIADDGYDTGWNTAITVDSSNRASVCYVDGSNNVLKYAHDTGSGWDVQTLTDSGSNYLGEPMDTCSIQLAPGNIPYISFYDHITKHLKLVHRSGTGWVTESVDSNGDSGSFSALKFFNSIPLIAYFQEGNLDLKYIRWGG